MGKYGEVALNATELVRARTVRSPVEAWERAALAAFPSQPSSRSKGCPKNAFLGLCEQGLIRGVPSGSYLRSKDNKQYALDAVALLRSGAVAHPHALWERVMQGRVKKHNQQMDVVISLWSGGLIAAR